MADLFMIIVKVIRSTLLARLSKKGMGESVKVKEVMNERMKSVQWGFHLTQAKKRKKRASYLPSIIKMQTNAQAAAQFFGKRYD